MNSQTCRYCGEEYLYCDCRTEHGLVSCDDLDCPAKLTPLTAEEIEIAYNHWRYHSLHHGCSHAR